MSLLHLAGSSNGTGLETLYPESVFSTYLYTGNGSTQTINNGIDLAGKGGLVWIKGRSSTFAYSNSLFDTVRGANIILNSNNTNANVVDAGTLTTFNSSGFSLGSRAPVNYSGDSFVSWTFRKAAKFFDIVTYTGNGVAGRQIPHSLGGEVGMIIVKVTSGSSDWKVYHKGTGATNALYLNTVDSINTNIAFWNDTNPTDSVFTVGATNNANGATYVAYLFAHDPTTDGIIQCGSYVGNSTAGLKVTLGWEPQYVLIKPAGGAQNWHIFDNMRGVPTNGDTQPILFANTSNADVAVAGRNHINFRADGFELGTFYNDINTAGNGTHIYLAIRRSMKVPTSGTEVFAIDQGDATATSPQFISGFTTDFSLMRNRTTTTALSAHSRLTQGTQLSTATTNAEAINATVKFDYMNGYWNAAMSDSFFAWMFKRAKGFFDVVCYTGDGVAGRAVNHNLGVVPELMIVKCRNTASTYWLVYHKDLGLSKQIFLNGTWASNDGYGAYTGLSGTYFNVSSLSGGSANSYTNLGGYTYIWYGFATLVGVSKVGSYTGNGSSQTINCGFSTGTRFVLIKRTDATGDWYIWDTARGIVAANDPHLSLNTMAAEVTTDDSVDPEASGFIVNQNTATNINVNGASYIFLAIA